VSAGPDPHPLPPRLPPFPPDKRAKIMATALAANRAAAFSVREVESQGVGLAHQGGEGMATGLPPASRAGEDGERARSEKNSHPPPRRASRASALARSPLHPLSLFAPRARPLGRPLAQSAQPSRPSMPSSTRTRACVGCRGAPRAPRAGARWSKGNHNGGARRRRVGEASTLTLLSPNPPSRNRPAPPPPAAPRPPGRSSSALRAARRPRPWSR